MAHKRGTKQPSQSKGKKKQPHIRNAAESLENPNSGWAALLDGDLGSSVTVNEHTALRLAACSACVRVISEDIGSIPLFVMRRLARGKERATKHPLYKILHRQANRYMTSIVWRKTMMTHVLLWGNHYSYIERDGASRTLGYWPLSPARTWAIRHNGELMYQTQTSNRVETLFPEEVLHIGGLSFDGITGLSVIGNYAKDILGGALSAQTFAQKFYENGAQLSGMLVHPGKLTEKAGERLRQSFERKQSGLQNAHRLAVIQEGMKWIEMGVRPEDSQYLQTRRFQKEDIATLFRVPPHMIGSLDRATFSNIEEQDIYYATHCLRPWLVLIEQEIASKAFSEDEQDEYFAEFNMEGLLRGNTAARTSFYREMWNIGAYTHNMILESEGHNTIENGDLHFVPLNMIPLEQIGNTEVIQARIGRTDQPGMVEAKQKLDVILEMVAAQGVLQLAHEKAEGIDPAADPIQPAEAKEKPSERQDGAALVRVRHRVARSFDPLFTDAIQRVINRETNALMRQAEKGLSPEWLDGFYKGQVKAIKEIITPTFNSYAIAVNDLAADEVGHEPADPLRMSSFLGEFVDGFVARYVAQSRERLVKGVDVASVAEEWRSGRASLAAAYELRRLRGAMMREAFTHLGIKQVLWHGDGCHACGDRRGQVMDIAGAFDGIKHPPASEACTCELLSVQT